MLPLAERKFIHISHIVSCNEFVIFIDDNKDPYGKQIQEFVNRVIKEAQQTSL